MTTTYIIIGLIIAAGVIYFYVNKSKEEQEVVVPQTKEEIEQVSFEEGITKLLQINLDARKNILDENILIALDTTIDSIRHITEEMNKYANFSESSVMFNRIIDKYLPELVYGYVNLKEAERATQADKMTADLTRLSTEVSLIETSLSSTATQDFEKTGKLISAMFQKFDGEV